MNAVVDAPHDTHQHALESAAPTAGRTADACAAADREAFGALYLQYLDPIYRYCYRRLGSHEDAEDATNEAFCKAFAAFARFHDQSFECWIFTIAHNVVVDACRRRRAHQPLEAASETVESAPTPEEAAIDAEQRRLMRGLVSQLPPLEQAILHLRVAGLTHAEIGVVLGRTTGSIKALNHRARARLRKLIESKSGFTELATSRS